MGAGWRIDQVDDGSVHVRPRGDLTDHPADPDCACGPGVEPVPRDDGSMGWLYTHASLDGRELTEADYRPPP